MASNTESQINLKTIQRVDSDIIEIIDNASQVAIYKYEKNLGKWEGTDIEGALFLYRRSVHPEHGFMIVNRMSTNNFVESVTGDMQFQLQVPYLLYKNHKGEIIGSWFYEEKDLQRISEKIKTIVQDQAVENEDIMSLLAHAHQHYAQSNLDSREEKRLQEKKVVQKASPTRSSSLKEDTPRRNPLLSTGSYDITKDCSMERFQLLPQKTNSQPSLDQRPLPLCLPPWNNCSQTKDWRLLLEKDKETHSRSMRQALLSHIGDNPKVVLSLHEAYVSSLKSLFHKN